MTKQGTILVVDDNKGILTAVQMLLGTCFEKVITISTPNKIKATLHDENIDVVLLDMNFSAGINTGNEGLFWLSEIKKEDASIQVVLFTAYADIDLAVRGEDDYEEEIRQGLEQKLDAMLNRQLYFRYKTAPTEEEREQARQEYLDRRGVPQSYRWTVPPWEL